MDEWKDSEAYNEFEDGWHIVDRWFSSEAWDNICNDASNDDIDSIELMEEVSENLANLIFHLNNESGHDRIAYELKRFQQLIADFEV